jgi:hypothetical protein
LGGFGGEVRWEKMDYYNFNYIDTIILTFILKIPKLSLVFHLIYF